jgi:hypothetical protein
METWLLVLDCVINVGILGWLIYEHRHPNNLVLYIKNKEDDPPN